MLELIFQNRLAEIERTAGGMEAYSAGFANTENGHKDKPQSTSRKTRIVTDGGNKLMGHGYNHYQNRWLVKRHAPRGPMCVGNRKEAF